LSAILEGLNEAQLEAVTAPDGPVLVLAGPGSGKTRVLTHRAAWLVRERDIPPWRIMAVTFTNKAAREMRHRVEDLLGGDLQGTTLGTFHAICARILRREATHLPITRDYVIFDTPDQRALIKKVLTEDLNLDEKLYRPERILSRISAAKNERITADMFQPKSYIGEIVKRAYVLYQQRLVANNATDFDDLLLYAVSLFDEHPDVLARYQNSTDHVLVDEFQDTNTTQYALVCRLAEKHRRLFCVGDEDQSIYRWRGADYRNVLRLREDFPDLNTILLEQNYRSTQNILDAARAVIDRNANRTPKKLFTEIKGGQVISLYEAHNEQYEAQFVIDTIASLTAMGEAEPGQCAVMYRTNAQSRVLEDTFVRANLPYRLVGATRFYGRREIRDVIAYLRVIHNPEDTVSLMRVINTPPRGIGRKTLDALVAWAQKKNLSVFVALERLAEAPEGNPFAGRARNTLLSFWETLEGWQAVKDDLPLRELLKLVLDETGYHEYIDDGTADGEERWANVVELVNLAAEFEELDLATFLEEVSLVSDIDTLQDDVNAPTLLTLHAAKGLEFDAVFIVGLEEGLLPHSRSSDDPEAMAEERRLMYVGMTRARRHLYLSYTFQRTVWGDTSLNLPSQFIEDIPAGLITSVQADWHGTPYRQATTWSSGGPPRIRRNEQPAQTGMRFKAGQRVLHPRFGEGIVVESRASGNDEEVSVVFDDGGLKRLLASFANLTILDG
jgi:DNA helicase-2/ATP-dependent DNA helicase PcrA